VADPVVKSAAIVTLYCPRGCCEERPVKVTDQAEYCCTKCGRLMTEDNPDDLLRQAAEDALEHAIRRTSALRRFAKKWGRTELSDLFDDVLASEVPDAQP